MDALHATQMNEPTLRHTQAGKSNDRPDRQDQTVPAEPLAQGGSQSPEAVNP